MSLRFMLIVTQIYGKHGNIDEQIKENERGNSSTLDLGM